MIGKRDADRRKLSSNGVCVERGRSRDLNLSRLAPAAVGPLVIASAPTHDGPHATALRNVRYLLMGVTALPLIGLFSRTPAERWEPVYGWLDARCER